MYRADSYMFIVCVGHFVSVDINSETINMLIVIFLLANR